MKREMRYFIAKIDKGSNQKVEHERKIMYEF